MSFKSKLIFPFGAIALGVIAALILLEVTLRVLGVGARDVFTVNVEEYRAIPGIYAPDQTFTGREIQELPYPVRINSLGYRGDELPIDKPKGELRIFMTGDSFIYGDFVSNEETFPAQLESNLRRTCSNVRVINAGLRGGSIIGQAALIERGLQMDPDLVILNFFENDIEDMANPLWDGIARNRIAKSQFPLSILYPMLRYTSLWELALKVRSTLRSQSAVRQVTTLDVSSMHERNNGLESTYWGTFMEVHDTLQKHGIPLIFTTYPDHKTVGAKGSELNMWINEQATAEGITTVSLLPILLSAGTTTELYALPFNAHPSPYGYAVVGKYLSEFLMTHDVLTTRCDHVR